MSITAEDFSSIRSVAVGASLAAGIGGDAGVAVAIGLSIAFNSIHVDVAAAIIAAKVTTTAGAVTVRALSHGSELFTLTGVDKDELDDAAQGAEDDSTTDASTSRPTTPPATTSCSAQSNPRSTRRTSRSPPASTAPT